MKRMFMLGLVMSVLFSCKHEAPTPTAPPPTDVSVAEVFTEKLPVFLSLPGTTAAVSEVEIQARVEGWLTQRHFKEGQIVNQGDLLYEIDAAPFEAQLLEAEASFAGANAQADYAQKEIDRNAPLVQAGAIAEQDFDKLETQLEQAVAQVVQTGANVALAKLNVEYCTIHAPITGKIGRSTVAVGTLVGPGVNSKLATIVQVSPMYVEFHPPSNRLLLIQSLMKSNGSLPIHVTVMENASEGQASVAGSVMTEHTATGSLVFVDNTIQSTTSTFLARGEFVNSIGVLPGQYASIRLQLQVIDDAVVIPLKAIMQQPGSYYVWTISDKKTAVITPVTLGAIQGDYQHVLSGLKAGDVVIVDGTANLRSGAAVAVANASGKAK
jgi:RND family efflux transporter MFP subunit